MVLDEFNIGECISPRAQGNRLTSCSTGAPKLCIPACAGEPCSGYKTGNARDVYPRVCGGTDFVCIYGPPGVGLSPRVQGNRLQSCVK